MLSEAGEPKLVINGLEIDKYEESTDSLNADVTIYQLPDHMLVDKKNSLKCMLDLDEEDAEALGRILGVDTDQLSNKKVRVLIQSLGPAKR